MVRSLSLPSNWCYKQHSIYYWLRTGLQPQKSISKSLRSCSLESALSFCSPYIFLSGSLTSSFAFVKTCFFSWGLARKCLNTIQEGFTFNQWAVFSFIDELMLSNLGCRFSERVAEIPSGLQSTAHSIGLNSGGLGVSRPPRFWAGGRRAGRGRFVKHYYILSCTGSMFESGDFWSEIE